jgi:hypothetical protein
MAMISEQEKLSRRLAVESVIGTNAMEGLTPDEPTAALLLDYEEGVLTLDQFSSAMDRHAHHLLAEQGKLAGAA